MSEQKTQTPRDYSETLFLPKTDFPMRAGLPKKEPELIARWQKMNLYQKLRKVSKGKEKYVLHDGPPYANGNLHIGHALNKILKDMVTRSMQMRGYDSNYVPGWDCHGLPIEWKIEEKYRQKGKNKDDIPVNEFREECRAFAKEWIGIQSEEFRRLGVEGDFEKPYTTMDFKSEAIIAKELLKFARTGQLYRGSKPVMWSVVEKTALAEAEVEYEMHESDTVWVKFPIIHVQDIEGASCDMQQVQKSYVVIWTTTPWTIPGNRAVCFSSRINYGVYKVATAENDYGPRVGEQYIFADALASECAAKAKIKLERISDINPKSIISCGHPLKGFANEYDFQIPLLDGDHVTEEAGTGFVHTAPGHGRDDFEIWMANAQRLEQKGISSEIPFTVDADGKFTKDAPGFEGKTVITEKGKKGDANKAVIEQLIAQDMLFSRGRLKHQYPHSWRSKKPVIFRNTPQWFVYMDKSIEGKDGDTLRNRALKAIDETRFVPKAGQNRLNGMIQSRPDWVLSRQRAWGVPITVFVHKETSEILQDETVNDRIITAFENEGADAWFAEGAKQRFLGNDHSPEDWEQVSDILDVWFDSGSTHAFVLEQREDLKWPADLYLEGSDQHRGWFHSSLLEGCGTRGRAPYDAVLTHGFVMAEDGRKMSKSLGNIVAPQEVIKQSGADILRLWVASSDYSEDLRIGPEILKTSIDAYKKLRNTMRWMLGTLNYFDGQKIELEALPELERLMLHRLTELDKLVRQAYSDFDYKRVFSQLFNFLNVELSAFYFDIRKDALYCDPMSSPLRKASLYVISELFESLTKWLAPILPFTMEEAWLSRYPSEDGSVHLEQFKDIPEEWHDQALAARWAKIKTVRKVVTGALEIERKEKRIGSSLEAAPEVFISDKTLRPLLEAVDLAEICITSQIQVFTEAAPKDVFALGDVEGVAVRPALAQGKKCQRCWKVLPDVGDDADYPDLSPRDAAAVREYDAAARAAE
ncbi:MAG: isoleucine--tRNA ligase [Pseudomonadota bacterium]